MDEALDALVKPLAARPMSGRVLWVGARPFAPLRPWLGSDVLAVQPWRGPAAALEGAGERVVSEVPTDGGFDGAVVLPEGQRAAALGAVGRAAASLRPGGRLVVSTPNKQGAQALERRITALSPVSVETRRHSRVLEVHAPEALVGLAAEDAPRTVLDGTFTSRPGLFSWDEVDPGSALLASVLPDDLGARVLDAGAGWGWLSRGLARRDGVRALWLAEADARALTLAVPNTAAPDGVTVHAAWVDLAVDAPRAQVDAVVTNPPFHAGGKTDPAVGLAFLRGALRWLRPGGSLWLVANAHLPYEAALRSEVASLRKVEEAGGYKVLAAIR